MIKGCESYLQPQTPYAASKLKAEKGLAGIPGLRYCTIRFGTIFGLAPVMSIQTAINKFCWQACNAQPITTWKTALHQWRPYLDIEDALRLIVFLIRTRNFDRKTYNAATLHANIFTIAKTIHQFLPSLKSQTVEAKAMNALSYKVSTLPLRRLGFCFKGDLKHAVKEMTRSLPGVSQFTK